MNLREQLIREEGRVPDAYPDPISPDGNPWTIGVGHTGPEVHRGLRWTDAQIDAALDKDIATAAAGITAALPWFAGLDRVRQAAIIGMAFQMGVKGVLGFQRMLGAVRDEHYADAETYAMSSLWAKQTPQRARRIARQLATGEWQ